MSLRLMLTAVMLVAVCSVGAAIGLHQPSVGKAPYPLSYKLKMAKGEDASSLMLLP